MDLTELEASARDRMPAAAFDYYVGGAETETTLRENLAAWDRWRLRPRILRDVRAVRLTTTVLGTEVAMPILVAPTAYQRLAHDDGEVATARGAAVAGTLMVVSTLATTALEEVAAATSAAKWFQLYVVEDRVLGGELIDRAREAGYGALVLTVDAPVLGYRPRDERNRFTLPPPLRMANVPRDLPDADGSALAAFATNFDRSLTFDDIAWLKERSGLPVVIKGVHRGDDAAACADAGADAVVVSNHGGRQCDSAVATGDVLPEVVEAVGGRIEVYVDGGIRRGTDVLKALALGARAVWVGRPVLWGLCSGGADGVADVLTALAADTTRTMTLCGVTDVRDVPRDLVTPAPR